MISWPCTSAGTNGIGGATMMLAMVESSSGAASASATNEPMTSGVAGRIIMPPTTVSTWCNSNWNRVATPRSEERRVGKECRSLCDWSSDVCSSDLGDERANDLRRRRQDHHAADDRVNLVQLELEPGRDAEIGRASCRERV